MTMLYICVLKIQFMIRVHLKHAPRLRIFLLCRRTIGGILLFFALWFGSCLFDTFLTSILKFSILNMLNRNLQKTNIIKKPDIHETSFFNNAFISNSTTYCIYVQSCFHKDSRLHLASFPWVN